MEEIYQQGVVDPGEVNPLAGLDWRCAQFLGKDVTLIAIGIAFHVAPYGRGTLIILCIVIFVTGKAAPGIFPGVC